jgi:DNA-binding response OmpR family regulator
MPRILVIDDQKDVRAMIAIVLRVRQFEVIEAESAAAGLKTFQESRFDLAIVDIFLQDACGFDVMSRMRDLAPELPIVAISGMTSLDAAPQSAEMLDVVCLQKPFRPNDLINAIEEARRRAQGAAGERAAVARAV